MRFYDADETRERLAFAPLVDALRAMFARGCELPPRQVLEIAGSGAEPVTSLVMPAWQAGGCYGVKVVNIAPGNAARGLPGLHSTLPPLRREHRRAARLDRRRRDHGAAHRSDVGAGGVVARAGRRAPPGADRRRPDRPPAAGGASRGPADRSRHASGRARRRARRRSSPSSPAQGFDARARDERRGGRRRRRHRQLRDAGARAARPRPLASRRAATST